MTQLEIDAVERHGWAKGFMNLRELERDHYRTNIGPMGAIGPIVFPECRKGAERV
jgi:hypothetical protein